MNIQLGFPLGKRLYRSLKPIFLKSRMLVDYIYCVIVVRLLRFAVVIL